eukprot:2813836-Rhodomonas_salina.1
MGAHAAGSVDGVSEEAIAREELAHDARHNRARMQPDFDLHLLAVGPGEVLDLLEHRKRDAGAALGVSGVGQRHAGAAHVDVAHSFDLVHGMALHQRVEAREDEVQLVDECFARQLHVLGDVLDLRKENCNSLVRVRNVLDPAFELVCDLRRKHARKDGPANSLLALELYPLRAQLQQEIRDHPRSACGHHSCKEQHCRIQSREAF